MKYVGMLTLDTEWLDIQKNYLLASSDVQKELPFANLFSKQRLSRNSYPHEKALLVNIYEIGILIGRGKEKQH